MVPKSSKYTKPTKAITLKSERVYNIKDNFGIQ